MTAVILPWRPTEGRRPAYELTRAFYRATLPDAPIFEVDTPHEQFNLGACRNKGVVKAQEIGHEVVVISDADTIPPVDSLHEAIAGAHEDNRLHFPYEVALYSGYSAHPGRANGGVFAVSIDGWYQCGGQDERIEGWGGEDDQLVAASTCLVGPPVRHPGVAVAMWHPACRDIGSERHRPNAVLAHRYWDAVGNPERMRALMAER